MDNELERLRSLRREKEAIWWNQGTSWGDRLKRIEMMVEALLDDKIAELDDGEG